MDIRFRKLIEIFSLPRQVTEERFSPYFFTYFESFFADRRRLFRKIREMEILVKRIGPTSGRKILDVGCGFGLEAVILALLLEPDSQITGFDHNEEKIRLAKKLADEVDVTGIEFRLRRGEDPEEGETADITLCRDVVSHVYDIHLFLDAMSRLLRKQGVLYIIDDRNALSPLTVWKTRTLQKRADSGTPDANRLRANDTPQNFSQIRREIIADRFKLPAEKLDRYTRLTAGLYGDMLISFVEKSEKGERVERPEFKYVNPRTGESYERLYNPYYLKRLLKKRGYRAAVERPFFGFTPDEGGLKKKVGRLIEIFHPLSLFIAPIYCIKGTKANNDS